jgi:imidazolonepropionase-like amidohydrolase
VLHTHSLVQTLASRLYAGAGHVRFEDYELIKAFRGQETHDTELDVPVLANNQHIPTLAAQVDVLLDRGTMWGYLIEGHGMYAWGRDMAEARRQKRKPVIDGQDRVWPLAKKLGVKLAWGTDFLFEPALNADQNSYILRLKPWFTPAEILKMVTHDNAQLLALSGLRSPYPGSLGVVKPGALADLILVAGDPLANIDLVADPARNFRIIMKDGVVVKGD